MTAAKKRQASAKTAADALERVRAICLALPDTTEKLAWGEPTFRVHERLFVMFTNNHHGDGRLAIWCNAPDGAQEAIVAADPKHFFVPPYVGKGGWIGINLDTGLGWPAIASLIAEAHRVTAAKGKGRKKR
ncbi:MAG: MmcQ/YjbR family DNA-binding protein [Acidobacteria bacterium]|nr:MmcQ/YjbR family DNA-binding protein [Acidobacteriota bacterium]MBV9474805.1 MmcQ/YjbR family DNA-binding protein [Acidobacteriota bacterium]